MKRWREQGVSRIRVLIIDDSPEARDALASILGSDPEIEIVGLAVDARGGMALVRELHPDLVLIDAQLPDAGSAEATRLIKRDFQNVRVIVLAVHASHAELALESGADRCLMKDSPRQELLETVRELAAGADD